MNNSRKMIFLGLLSGLIFAIFISMGGLDLALKTLSKKEDILLKVESVGKEEDLEDIGLYGNNILKFRSGRINIYNMEDIRSDTISYDLQEPKIFFKENIYLADLGLGRILGLKPSGEEESRLDMAIEIRDLDEINNKLIVYTQEDNKEGVYYMDKSQLVLGHFNYEDSYILKGDINKKGDRILVARLKEEGPNINSIIELYGPNKELIFQREFEDEFYFYSKILSGDRVFLATSKGLYLIDSTDIKWARDYDLIKDIAYIDGKIHILYLNFYQVLDQEGEEVFSRQLHENYEKISPYKDGVIIYGRSNMSIFRGKDFILNHSEEIIDLKVSDDKILIEGPNSISIYKVVRKPIEK